MLQGRRVSRAQRREMRQRHSRIQTTLRRRTRSEEEGVYVSHHPPGIEDDRPENGEAKEI